MWNIFKARQLVILPAIVITIVLLFGGCTKPGSEITGEEDTVGISDADDTGISEGGENGSDGANVYALGTGYENTCAIKIDGTLWCWGANHDGQVGNLGTDDDVLTPAQIGNESNWTIVTLGFNYVCAIKNDGTLWCWGSNDVGQIGDGTVGTDRNVPTRVGTWSDWKSISTGSKTSCGIRNGGTLWCWGSNYYGQIGDNTSNGQKVPTQEDTGSTNWASVTAGAAHTCALKKDDSLWCWGSNYYGQLGNGTTDDKKIPTQIGNEKNWAMIAAGGTNYTCGLKKNGTLWCWGHNGFGQLGVGTYDGKNTPTQVGTDTDWMMIFTSRGVSLAYTCGVKNDGSLYCWGNNKDGQLGDGTTAKKLSPTKISAISNVIDAALGKSHACAITDPDSLWCWGENYWGQLGDGTKVNMKNPTEVTAF